MLKTRLKNGCSAAIGLSLLLAFCPFASQVEAIIVFAAQRNGDAARHIYLMDDDGSNVRRITDPAFWDTYPRWFPDGQRVLFTRDYTRGNGAKYNAEFFILDLKSGNAERFMENHPTDLVPDVSPDGKTIAFNSERGGAWDIYVIHLETEEIQQLTDIGEREGWAYRMDWSPDGRQLAYEWEVAPEGDNIWLMAANGDRKRRLTPPSKGLNPTFRGAPSWSPSGKYIMYRENERTPDLQHKLAEKLVFHNVQTNLRRVHTFPKETLIAYYCWMGSDRTVLLSMKDDYTNPLSNYEIYRYEVVTRHLTNLTNQQGGDYHPGWVAGSLSVSPVEKLTTFWGALKDPENTHR